MKTNEEPEKIYCHRNELGYLVFSGQPFNYAKEYTHTNAFIEKALSWLKNHYRDYMHNPTGKRLEAFFGVDMCNDFKNYMKGE